MNILKFIVEKMIASIFYLRFGGEIFCTSLEEVSERRAKGGKKERRSRYESTALGQLL